MVVLDGPWRFVLIPSLSLSFFPVFLVIIGGFHISVGFPVDVCSESVRFVPLVFADGLNKAKVLDASLISVLSH